MSREKKIEYVHREGIAATAHAGLAALCCCYSVCRMVVVKQGEVGLTQNSEKPEMLGPGRHCLLSPFNSFLGIRQVTEPVIRHGPLHIIRVEMGQLGYAVDMKSGRPIILAVRPFALFPFPPCTVHLRLRVRSAASTSSTTVLLPLHAYDSQWTHVHRPRCATVHFLWKKFITLRDRITQLDQLSIIRIETGYIGYAFKRGNLKILKPGLHMIEL